MTAVSSRIDRIGARLRSRKRLDRFWSKVRKGPGDGCWNWTGCLTSDGYGVFRAGGATWSAHRYSLAMASNRWAEPPSVFACHHCDNPACVRPDHLFWGDNSENQKDCHRKGRSNLQRLRQDGEHNSHAKLTAENVATIRERVAAGHPRREIAKCFGVSYETVRSIELGKTWKQTG